jgi:hypothetical protein
MNWAYLSMIEALVVATVLCLIWIGIYKATSKNSKDEED